MVAQLRVTWLFKHHTVTVTLYHWPTVHCHTVSGRHCHSVVIWLWKHLTVTLCHQPTAPPSGCVWNALSQSATFWLVPLWHKVKWSHCHMVFPNLPHLPCCSHTLTLSTTLPHPWQRAPGYVNPRGVTNLVKFIHLLLLLLLFLHGCDRCGCRGCCCRRGCGDHRCGRCCSWLRPVVEVVSRHRWLLVVWRDSTWSHLWDPHWPMVASSSRPRKKSKYKHIGWI